VAFKEKKRRREMKQNRLWIAAASAIAGGMIGNVAATQLSASAALAAPHHRQARIVKAERFVVVDPNGEDRISMQVAEHGVADIALADAQGRNRAKIRVTPQGGAAIGFYDADGANRLMVGLTDENSPGIAMYSGKGRQLMAMAAKGDGEMALTLYDPNTGLARAGLGLAPDGSPAFVMFDKKGAAREEMSLGKHDEQNVAVVDQTGKTIAALGQQVAGR
jgi:hypothetical protein